MDLENRINELPIGSIGTKKVKNKTYYYHRYYVDGKKLKNI